MDRRRECGEPDRQRGAAGRRTAALATTNAPAGGGRGRWKHSGMARESSTAGLCSHSGTWHDGIYGGCPSAPRRNLCAGAPPYVRARPAGLVGRGRPRPIEEPSRGRRYCLSRPGSYPTTGPPSTAAPVLGLGRLPRLAGHCSVSDSPGFGAFSSASSGRSCAVSLIWTSLGRGTRGASPPARQPRFCSQATALAQASGAPTAASDDG